MAAAEDALRQVDAVFGITVVDGVCRVIGLVTILGQPHRSTAEARDLARRMVLDRAYLDAAIEFLMPGIVDERPAPKAAPALAITVA